MSETISKFEGWAIVEIMGHQTAAGYVTTEAFGAVVMFKVVQAELPPEEKVIETPKYLNGEYLPIGSKIRVSRKRAETYIGAGSIYRMTPCTEEEAVRSQPVDIEVIEKAQRQIPAGIDAEIVGDTNDPDYFDDSDREEP